MNKRMVFAVCLILAIAAGLNAQKAKDWKFKQTPEGALQRLDLTAQEIQEVKKLSEELQAKSKQILADMKILKAELEKILLGKDPAKEAYAKIVKEISDKQVELQMLKIDMGLKVKQLVGDEKAKKLLKAIQARKDALKGINGNKGNPLPNKPPLRNQRRFLQYQNMPLWNGMPMRKR